MRAIRQSGTGKAAALWLSVRNAATFMKWFRDVFATFSGVRRLNRRRSQVRKELSIKGWNIGSGSLNRAALAFGRQTWLI
jgi:hypothetical protein